MYHLWLVSCSQSNQSREVFHPETRVKKLGRAYQAGHSKFSMSLPLRLTLTLALCPKQGKINSEWVTQPCKYDEREHELPNRLDVMKNAFAYAYYLRLQSPTSEQLYGLILSVTKSNHHTFSWVFMFRFDGVLTFDIVPGIFPSTNHIAAIHWLHLNQYVNIKQLVPVESQAHVCSPLYWAFTFFFQTLCYFLSFVMNIII